MRRLFGLFASVVAIGVGIVTLIGLATGGLPTLTGFILQLALVTAAAALLVGVVNLLSVHFRRILGRERGVLYSFALILSFLLVIIFWLFDADEPRRILLQDVQVSLESALAALLVFALVYGAYRLMRRRVTWGGILFTLALLISLLGALPLSQLGALTSLRQWLLAVPVSAGARGLLIGIALAAVVVGMRALIGQERSYRE
jgi:hypothetical protein